jgi:chemotaxis protein MotB
MSAPRAGNGKRVVHHDDGEGNWLISYADIMTLPFGFFVVLAAFSTPDAAKMERLKQETAKSMGVEYTKPFETLSESLKAVLQKMQLDKDITLEETVDGVAIISKGTLFFDSGSVELKPAAAKLMGEIATVVVEQAKGFRVVVEGHTDDVPVNWATMPSNWELSSARAGTVVRLLEAKGFSHYDLRPVGLADTEALVPNRTPDGAPIAENRAQNRRIVIRIQKQLPRRTGARAEAAKQVAAPAAAAEPARTPPPAAAEPPAPDAPAVGAPPANPPAPAEPAPAPTRETLPATEPEG